MTKPPVRSDHIAAARLWLAVAKKKGEQAPEWVQELASRKRPDPPISEEAPAEPAAEPAAPARPGDPIVDAVVSIVADLTGFPPELLDLDLDLEADLGVEADKQAEVFAAVRERFDVPRDDAIKLRDFPTLRHAVDWVQELAMRKRPDLPVPEDAAQGEAPAHSCTIPLINHLAELLSPDSGDSPVMRTVLRSGDGQIGVRVRLGVAEPYAPIVEIVEVIDWGRGSDVRRDHDQETR